MAATVSTGDENVPALHYAAMLVAVGWLRGELYDVVSGQIDRDRLQRLLDATSTASIAKLLDKDEDDLLVDTEHYLPDRIRRAIGGESA